MYSKLLETPARMNNVLVNEIALPCSSVCRDTARKELNSRLQFHIRSLGWPQRYRVKPRGKEPRKQWHVVILSPSHSSVQQCKADIRMSGIIIADANVCCAHIQFNWAL